MHLRVTRASGICVAPRLFSPRISLPSPLGPAWSSQFFTCLVILFACEVAAGIWGFVNKDQVSPGTRWWGPSQRGQEGGVPACCSPWAYPGITGCSLGLPLGPAW